MSDKNEITTLKNLIKKLEEDVGNAKSILSAINEGNEDQGQSEIMTSETNHEDSSDDRIVEGAFDGQGMVGPDGRKYTVPPNYASKSKLVEGDILKLTILPDGSFVYKQILPVGRERLMGTLVKDQKSNEFRIQVGKKIYKVLLASVTYFKGNVGDEVVILVPSEGESKWATVENIIKNPLHDEEVDLELGI